MVFSNYSESRNTRPIMLALSMVFLIAAAVGGYTQTMEDARGKEVSIEDTSRILTAGSVMTEIVAALGHEDKLVAVDESSSYPSDVVDELPQVGYVRDLGAEGVLSVDPTILITNEDAGPPEVIDQIEEAGVPVFMVPEEDTVDGAFEKIRTIGAILGAEREADEIVDGIETDIEEARERAGEFSADDPVRVLFVYARGSGSVNASGHGTAAHAMIELAGAENAVDGYDGFRSLTPESAVEAEPDVLLFMDSGLASLGGEEGLSEIESLRLTPAYEEDRIASMDGTYLLGFGPRLGEAVGDLVVELQDVME